MVEYIGFVSQQTAGGGGVDQGKLATEWRLANDHIRELERTEGGWADSPTVEAIDPALAPLQQQVLADPIFQKSFALVPTEIRVVELDRLVVYQKYINLNYVRQLRAQLGDRPTSSDIFKFCLPWEHPRPKFGMIRSGYNVFVFSSPSNDLRFMEPVLLTPDQLQSYSPHGPVAGVLGLVVGFSSNFLNAIQLEGRLVLNNGSHRAYALREAGITNVPCVIQKFSRREELEGIAPQELQQKPDLYLKNPRPPLLKDYFDSKLRGIFAVPQKARQVKVSFGVETIDVPAS